MADQNKVCIKPGCESKQHCRGLCANCYQILGNAVRAGKVTWAQLESAGKVLPAKSTNKKSDTLAWALEGI